jgi:mRNA interferase MazF
MSFWKVQNNFPPKDYKVKCNQIRTIDKKRLVNFVSTLLPEKLEKVERALLIHLDVD